MSDDDYEKLSDYSDYDEIFQEDEDDDDEEGEFSKKEKKSGGGGGVSGGKTGGGDDEDENVDDEDDEDGDEDIDDDEDVEESNNIFINTSAINQVDFSAQIPIKKVVPDSDRKSQNILYNFEYAAAVGYIAELLASDEIDPVKIEMTHHDDPLNCAEEILEKNPHNILDTITMTREINNEIEHWKLSELIVPSSLLRMKNINEIDPWNVRASGFAKE